MKRNEMQQCMTYKNFLGSISFSAEDEVFYGKVEEITGLVTFEGTSVEELRISFQEAVDDYIELCNQTGEDPQKTYTGVFNVRVRSELHRAISRKALQCQISLNKAVEKAIENWVTTEK